MLVTTNTIFHFINAFALNLSHIHVSLRLNGHVFSRVLRKGPGVALVAAARAVQMQIESLAVASNPMQGITPGGSPQPRASPEWAPSGPRGQGTPRRWPKTAPRSFKVRPP